MPSKIRKKSFESTKYGSDIKYDNFKSCKGVLINIFKKS